MLIGLVLMVGALDKPVLPEWMAGCWEQRKGENWTEECWTAPGGGVMLGSGRTVVGGKLRDWEAMQIMLHDVETNAKMVFWASPGGKNRTAFAWSPSEMSGVTFYNVAHDYPQRVRYWREGEQLKAEVSLADGSKPMRWTYKRVQAGR
jgi:formylmethanofuran dehydrogenase subunit B